MSTPKSPVRAAARPGVVQRLRHYLPDMAAFAGALITAGLAALLLGSLHGCGGGVGGEGTGSYAMGPVSGYGSIVVNGIHFDESAAQVTDDDGLVIDRAALALGTVVQVSGGLISTGSDGNPSATAATVRTVRGLLGPVSAVDAAAGTLTVLGQTVAVSADTVFDERLTGGLAGLVDGQVLEVYGDYDSAAGRYVATRVALAGSGSGWRVRGPVSALDSAGRSFRIGSQTYSFAAVADPGTLSEGQVVSLALQTATDSAGRWLLSAQPATSAPPQDREVAGLHGVVARIDSAQRFVVDGVTIDATSARLSGSVAVGARVEVSGALRAGVLVASTVTVEADTRTASFGLLGEVSALDTAARTLMLRQTTVYYGRGDLVVSGGTLAALAVGKRLRIEAVLSADRTRLEATSLAFVD